MEDQQTWTADHSFVHQCRNPFSGNKIENLTFWIALVIQCKLSTSTGQVNYLPRKVPVIHVYIQFRTPVSSPSEWCCKQSEKDNHYLSHNSKWFLITFKLPAPTKTLHTNCKTTQTTIKQKYLRGSSGFDRAVEFVVFCTRIYFWIDPAEHFQNATEEIVQGLCRFDDDITHWLTGYEIGCGMWVRGNIWNMRRQVFRNF
jgi:hypothetical protein